MLEALREGLRRVSVMAEGAAFAVEVLNRTGFLGSLSPSGMLAFARSSRGLVVGPHLALMLHAKNKPEKIGLVVRSRRYKLVDLDREINQLGCALLAMGVRAGSRLGLMLPNSAESVIARQAAARLGAISVALERELDRDAIAQVLESFDPDAVMVHEGSIEAFAAAAHRAGRPDDDRVIVTGCAAEARPGLRMRYEDLIAKEDGGQPPVQGTTESFDPAGLEAVADFVSTIGMGHHDRYLAVCPLDHGSASDLVAMMCSLGGTVVLQDGFDVTEVLSIITRERITCAFMLPFMLERMAEIPDQERARYDTSSLRWICTEASGLNAALARRFQERYGRILWSAHGAPGIGLVTLASPDDHAERRGTAGRALRGSEARLLDSSGTEVPIGEVGELHVRNAALVTRTHFSNRVFAPPERDGFSAMGDLARVDPEGYYYLEPHEIAMTSARIETRPYELRTR